MFGIDDLRYLRFLYGFWKIWGGDSQWEFRFKWLEKSTKMARQAIYDTPKFLAYEIYMYIYLYMEHL